MSLLPEQSTGTLTYNGFVFPPAVHTSVRANPVTDSTGRFTKYTRYQIQVEMILFPGVDSQVRVDDQEGNWEIQANSNTVFPDALESAGGTPYVDGEQHTRLGMEKLRELLLAQGKVLQFTGKGLGYDLAINTKQSDIEYGPRPKVLAWEPIGDNCSVRVVWAVEVAIADCLPLTNNDGRVTEFGYTSTYSLDENGYTSRTISGYLEIAARLAAGGVQQRSVDQLRHTINVVVPLQFQRIAQRYTVSPDHRSLTFSVVDRQVPSDNPLPIGCSRADVTHNVTSTGEIIKGRLSSR